MSADNLREMLLDELRDIYDAEQRITSALPKLAEAANSRELAAAFEGHLQQTHDHVSRLEQAFGILHESPKRRKCKAMVGLLEEGEELMKESGVPGLRDVALIAAAQKVEHYEMATYGCLRAWAETLGEDLVSQLLQKTLDEEGAADHKLTALSIQLNAVAMKGDFDKHGENFTSERRFEAGLRPDSRSNGH